MINKQKIPHRSIISTERNSDSLNLKTKNPDKYPIRILVKRSIYLKLKTEIQSLSIYSYLISISDEVGPTIFHSPQNPPTFPFALLRAKNKYIFNKKTEMSRQRKRIHKEENKKS
ncbi:hypothetical protein V6Z12_D02G000500 [Gossypium hirsutum]